MYVWCFPLLLSSLPFLLSLFLFYLFARIIGPTKSKQSVRYIYYFFVLHCIVSHRSASLFLLLFINGRLVLSSVAPFISLSLISFLFYLFAQVIHNQNKALGAHIIIYSSYCIVSYRIILQLFFFPYL